jgi:hypothetical protein
MPDEYIDQNPANNLKKRNKSKYPPPQAGDGHHPLGGLLNV